MQEKITFKKCICKCWFFYIEIWIFVLQNAIITFYNLHLDYWDLITNFSPGSTKWNTPFIPFLKTKEYDEKWLYVLLFFFPPCLALLSTRIHELKYIFFSLLLSLFLSPFLIIAIAVVALLVDSKKLNNLIFLSESNNIFHAKDLNRFTFYVK